MPKLVFFRDWDPLYKWPWTTTGWGDDNKIGYLTMDGVLIYPFGYGVKRVNFIDFRRPHRIVSLPSSPLDSNIELYFTNNCDNKVLLNHGFWALGNYRALFYHPIKLPRLTPISPSESGERWNRFISLLQPGYNISTLDTKSIVSHIIAKADHGVWSHTATYVGDGKICEAISQGIVVRSINVYKSPRYRLGLYRIGMTPAQLEMFIAYSLAQVGKRYSYRKLAIVGLQKLLGLRPNVKTGRKLWSPNELLVLANFELVFLV